MKLIFLDIDGVLNSEGFYHSRDFVRRDKEFLNDRIKAYEQNLDPRAIDYLNMIINRTDAEIILSSSWRWQNNPQGNENTNIALQNKGLKKRFIDITPRFAGDLRGNEIKAFLEEFEKTHEVENYVILDDDVDMLDEQKEHFVNTDWHDGLTFKNAVDAANILLED